LYKSEGVNGMGAFEFVQSKSLKQKYTDADKLKFGKIFTDYMLTMKYSPGKGWHDKQIRPYEDFRLDPAAMVLHYGQAMFEGLKAYRAPGGRTLLFRPKDNFRRMNSSARRLCMAELDEGEAYEGLLQLLRIEKDWVPDKPGTSLYIRPTMIATDPYLGVKASDDYLFFIILSPVGPYYPEGFAPIKIFVENEYVRAVKGGMGYTKAAANYAASILAGELAKKIGYSQVLWLDGIERKFVEEVGSMNIGFQIAGEFVTPELGGSILPGITRDSVMALAREMGLKVTERKVSIQEVFDAHEKGTLEDVFGMGTAAVISPVGELNWDGKVIHVNGGKPGKLALELYDKLTEIQYGKVKDTHNWVVEVK
jgi:branched-chain amino acid aminotransferase